MAQFIENLKKYFKNVSDRRFLEKFEDKNYFFRAGYEGRVRWFELVGRKERVWALEKGYVRDAETLNRLFPKYANLVAPYMNLRDEQFAVILQEGYFDALKKFVESNTLNLFKLRAFIDTTIRRAGKNATLPMSEESKLLPELLNAYLVREGVPTPIVQFVSKYPADEIEAIKLDLKGAAFIHSQVLAVKNGMTNCEVNDRFVTFLSYLKKENVGLCNQAAVTMNGAQVKAFHKEGLHLSKEAIVALLAGDVYETTTYSILANEVLYPMWPELEYVLEAKPDTYYMYQKALLEGRLKKEANS